MTLGVNIDHVTTLREARKTLYPDPAVAALLVEYAGADSIVAHLREDRRHIKDKDVVLIKESIKIPFNLEMSVNKNIVAFARALKPEKATLVPERRKELTTEGGLNLKDDFKRIEKTVGTLKQVGIEVSLFIDPFKQDIDRAVTMGASVIEFNTGRYSEAKRASQQKKEAYRIREAVTYAGGKGLFVAAGHGLDYENVKEIAKIKKIKELNIGHSIISRAVFVGLVTAVEEMIDLIKQ